MRVIDKYKTVSSQLSYIKMSEESIMDFKLLSPLMWSKKKKINFTSLIIKLVTNCTQRIVMLEQDVLYLSFKQLSLHLFGIKSYSQAGIYISIRMISPPCSYYFLCWLYYRTTAFILLFSVQARSVFPVWGFWKEFFVSFRVFLVLGGFCGLFWLWRDFW